MELQVAGALSFRLAQQEHWRQADGVRDGRQSHVDPHGAELEELGDRVRVYRLHEAHGRIDGRQAVITQRLVKRLGPDGIWESDLVVDSYQHVGGPDVAVIDQPGRGLGVAA